MPPSVTLLDYSGKTAAKEKGRCSDLPALAETMATADDVNSSCLFWFGNMPCGDNIFGRCHFGT